MFSKVNKILACILWLALCVSPSVAQETNIEWHEVQPGFSVAKYYIPIEGEVLKPEVVLLKFDPKKFSFKAVRHKSFTSDLIDMRTLATEKGAVAAINANFFDPKGDPLGVVVSEEQEINGMHKGGSLLTGVFSIKDEVPFITHRSQFNSDGVMEAVQSGPRLITNSRAVAIHRKPSPSRRSGIAINKSYEVILYATVLRFPGATLQQIQQMLTLPELKIKDALNFDGGSSSQLFVKPLPTLKDQKELLPFGPKPVFISGGDEVPVGLIVLDKAKKSPKSE